MSHHRSRLLRWLFAGVLVTAACSGDDDESAPSTAPVDTGATTTAASTPSSDQGGEPPPTATTAEAGLTFGLIGPGLGLLNDLAIGQERGLTLAIDDINAAGGVLGSPVASVRVDEASDRPIDGVLDDLVAQGADVLLGPVGSQTATALVPIVAERGLVTCSASATAETVTDTTDGRTFFRTALRDDHLAEHVADRIMTPSEEGAAAPGTVMILGRDDVYGAELMGALAAHLTARGATVDTIDYPPRRVAFPDEAAAVAAAAPDVLVLAAFEEAPNLVAAVSAAGYPVGQIVGLDGLLVPRIAEQTFPSDPTQADGLTVIGTTGDRALMRRLRDVPAPQDQVSYGGQMYDCAITIALSVLAAGAIDSAAIGEQIAAVTAGGRTCSTFAHCAELLAAGEDIDYAGTTGGIAIDERGDISTARITTGMVVDGALTETGAVDVDLVAERQQEIFASSVLTTQLQLALRLLGYYEGDITGVYDEATTAAVAALQRDLGLPETGQYDEVTDAALRQLLGDNAGALSTSIAQLQEELTALGYYSGPIDGRYSAETIAAIRALQRDLGVPETGLIDVATLRAIYARGQQSAPPPPTAPPTTPTTPTTPPTAPPPDPDPDPTPPPTEPAAPETTLPAEDEPTIFAVLQADPQFSTFVDLLQAAGYEGDFADPRRFTLFAPTNDAFEPGQAEELATDPDLADLLAYHLVETAIPSSELVTGELTTFHGLPLEVVAGDPITVGGAAIVDPDIPAANGLVNAINAFLEPPPP